MAFLNFLKKSKKKGEHPVPSLEKPPGIDTPPPVSSPPPSLEKTEEIKPSPPPPVPPAFEGKSPIKEPEITGPPPLPPMEKAETPVLHGIKEESKEPIHPLETPEFPGFEIEKEAPKPEPINEEPVMEPPPVPPSKTEEQATPAKEKAVVGDIFRDEYRESVREITKPRISKPIFVTVDQYKRVVGKVDDTKSKLKEAEDTLLRIIETQSAKDTEYEKWYKVLGELQRKFIYIERRLFELEG